MSDSGDEIGILDLEFDLPHGYFVDQLDELAHHIADAYMQTESAENREAEVQDDNQIVLMAAGSQNDIFEIEPDFDRVIADAAYTENTLADLAKRAFLLKWCQDRTASYANVQIRDFDESWGDGLALCALIHSYMPDKIPFQYLLRECNLTNYWMALLSAESVGIQNTLDVEKIAADGKPFWKDMMNYVYSIYQHFET